MSTHSNPYIGPRPFKKDEADRFFGREREARDLLALVSSQRLVLFYASSGAGKSSLINARLIHALTDRGFEVLPVGRVTGMLPSETGIDLANANVFAYLLKQSLAEYALTGALSEADQSFFREYADASLSEFLLRLAHVGQDEQGDERYVFTAASPADAEIAAPPPEDAAVELKPRALIIDQFEEIFTTNLHAWEQRGDFFSQIRQAMEDDPYLWIVLAMREDFIANLDPLAHLLPGDLHARYYMQRMGYNAALEAVKKPVSNPEHREWFRPFPSRVAERLVDNLCLVRVTTEDGKNMAPVKGEFIEPVQLQVVCYQLWEQLRDTPGATITNADLDRLAGGQDLSIFVDRALSEFYEQVLRRVLDKAGDQVDEMELRRWFSERLITEAGTRSFVYRGESETGGLPNEVVRLIAAEFLIRSESRAGGAWYELSHDRFVDPIRRSNQRWSLEQLQRDPLLRRAHEWAASNPSDPGQRDQRLLLNDDELAALDLAGRPVEPVMHDFLEASQQAKKDRDLAAARQQQQAALQRERTARRLLWAFAGLLMVALLATVVAGWQWNDAKTAEATAVAAQTVSAANEAAAKTAEATAVAAQATSAANAADAEIARQEADDAQKTLQSVMLSRIVSRLNLASEDQRQFALLLSEHALTISTTLQAESASIQALEAAYRQRAGWQPGITQTVWFTEAVRLPFTEPLTTTLRRDGEAVAAVLTGPTVVVALNPVDWLTHTVTTDFARIDALALNDQGTLVAVAGCGHAANVKIPGKQAPAPDKPPKENKTSAVCDNWRIEILPIADAPSFSRTVSLPGAVQGNALVFHPYLSEVAAATEDGAVSHWSILASKPAARLVTTDKLDRLVDLAVSADGNYLAAIDAQGRSRVWVWATREGKDDDWPPDLKANSYLAEAFVRDGSWFAAISGCPARPNNQQPADPCPVLRLWDRESLTPIADPLAVADNTGDVVYNEQSQTLITVDKSRLVRWNLDRADWDKLICQRVGRSLTYDEWKEAFPDQIKDLTAYEGACSMPIHGSFAAARIVEAGKELDNCNDLGTKSGWDQLEYGDIPRLETAVTILLEEALARFERNREDWSSSAACLEQANALLTAAQQNAISSDDAQKVALQLLEAEAKLRSEPAAALALLGEVQEKITSWPADFTSRLAADYQTLCFDQGNIAACATLQELSPETTIAFGESKMGEILKGNEGAPWYFLAKQGQSVTIALNAVGDSFDPVLVLDGPGGRMTLAQNDDRGDGSFNSLISDQILPVDGMYRIRPEALSGSGAYRLTLTGQDLPRLAPDTPIPASSASGDRWLFEGNAGQIVALDLELGVSDSYASLSMTSVDNSSWSSWAETTDEDATEVRLAPVPLPADDLYVVQVSPTEATEPYTLTLRLAAPITLTLGEAMESTVAASSVWSFSGRPGQVISASLTSTDTTSQPVLDILSRRGDRLQSVVADSNSASVSLPGFILPDAGPYYLRVSGLNRASPYRLLVKNVEPPELRIDDTATSSTGSHTVWTLAGRPGQIVQISLTAAEGSSGLDTIVRLMNLDGQRIDSDDDYGSGYNSLLTLVLPPDSARLLLQADHYSGAGEFALSVSKVITEALPLDGTALTLASDRAWTLNGEIGQVLTIDIVDGGDGSYAGLQLFTADGRRIGSSDGSGKLVAVLPHNGTYVVVPRFDVDYGRGDTLKATLASAANTQNLNDVASQTLTSLATSGSINEAQALYRWGTTAGDVTFSADARGTLCRYGALHGAARQVSAICEKLLEGVETSDVYTLAWYHDARGLGRALSGKVAGAVEDFEFYASVDAMPYSNQRSVWAERLRAGEPVNAVFDAATLQDLLVQ